MTEKTERKFEKLLKDYPCLYYTRSLDKNNPGVKEICFNERYLSEAGYSLESYATTVLQHGFPR